LANGSIEAPSRRVTDLSSVEADLDRIASRSPWNSAASIGARSFAAVQPMLDVFRVKNASEPCSVMRSAALPTGVQWPASPRIDTRDARRQRFGEAIRVTDRRCTFSWFRSGRTCSPSWRSFHLRRYEKVLTAREQSRSGRLASFKSDVGPEDRQFAHAGGWFGDQSRCSRTRSIPILFHRRRARDPIPCGAHARVPRPSSTISP